MKEKISGEQVLRYVIATTVSGGTNRISKRNCKKLNTVL